ncbi:hypothetical protein QGN23_09990 [Chryseobacterium gotjawalense]|uniref:Aspartate racemase n=1 Tax=Chryseobacterium gotjawalense TaxID=3042315 RepID=A0ABY8RC64_9FLAO|nr:hypothetical protein [Chryseobacterium sp. wdc7]WHF50763.1 hypothetical protein QGN23_09990 [Chryseobacterium sp. wdc7]
MKADLARRGILGLGSASTEYYLNQIHRKYRECNSKFSTCPLLLYQIDFQEINPFLPNNFKVLIPKLKIILREISDLGITKLLIPNITLHETLDQIKSPFEICHPVQLTLDYLTQNRISKIFLFGTLYTVNSEYLAKKFSEKGIVILKPTSEDQIWMDDFRKEVYQNTASSAQQSFFKNLIKKYSAQNPVVIACTELSIFALKNEKACIDMAELQIEKWLE